MEFLYKALKGTLEHVPVTEEEVDRQLVRLQQTPRIRPVTDRPARNGDEVVLDYAGYCGGVQFEGGTAEKQSLTLGSGMFIPGFEEQLVGAKIGEEVTVRVTFPADYHAKELAGKEAEFRCKIHEIHQKEQYALDDTFAQEVGQCPTLEALRGRLRDTLHEYYEERAEIELQDSLMRQVASTLDYTPTEAELEAGVDAQIELLRSQLARKGLTLETYCQFTGSTEAQLREDAKPEAQTSLRIQRAAERIALLEGLRASAEEIAQELAGICSQNGMTLEQLRPYLSDDYETQIAANIRMKKAIGFVRSHAVVTEKTAAEKKN